MEDARPHATTTVPHQAEHLAVTMLILLYGIVVVRTAWVMDDAYIAFRCVDNAIHGLGLRWNTFERVEAFTNPLWTLVMCVFALATREVFYTGLVLQIGISIAAVWLVTRSARTPIVAAGCVATLTLSKAFVDYSTSGLENPLSHLLVASFATLYLRADDRSAASLRRMTLVGSLALVNRLDLVWLLLPCLFERATSVWTASRTDAARRTALHALVVGGLPLAAWELFSFFYYGAWIPNSALAKLNAHVPRTLLLWHGWSLVRDSLLTDPLTLLFIVAGASFARGGGCRRARTLAVGVVLTLAYVVWVGGDHMSGRFFTVPLLAAVMLLARAETGASPAFYGAVAATGLATAWMAGFATLNDQYASLRPAVVHDIEDYRREWQPTTGLLSRGLFSRGPDNDWINAGKAAREHPHEVPTWGGIGFAGYYAGPGVRPVDKYGLSDALLARLPIPDGQHEAYFKAGHFARAVPDGYMETVRDGHNQIRHPSLARYYDKLSFVTQGPLWSGRRLLEAIELGLGRYDSLLDEYVAFQDQKPIGATLLPPALEAQAGDAMRDCPSWWHPCAPAGAAFTRTGLRVTLGLLSHAHGVEVELTRAPYVVVFWRDDAELWRAPFGPRADLRGTVDVDPAVSARGFDAVSFLPASKDDYSRSLTYFQLTP